MPELKFDEVGKRFYQTGVSKCVLYPQDTTGAYPKGVAWNGVTSINESPEGAESNPQYADNIKYLDLLSAETFKCTLEAFMYPDEFEECDGSKEVADGVTIGQQDRKSFGLSYQTILGNDIENNNYGYLIHFVWGCKASPSEKAYSSVNESPEAATNSWEISTTPVPVTGFKPTATMVINSRKVPADKLKALEKLIYGSDESEAKLPTPDEVIALIGTTPRG